MRTLDVPRSANPWLLERRGDEGRPSTASGTSAASPPPAWRAAGHQVVGARPRPGPSARAQTRPAAAATSRASHELIARRPGERAGSRFTRDPRRRSRDAEVAVGHLRHARRRRATRPTSPRRAPRLERLAAAPAAGHARAGLVAGAGRLHAAPGARDWRERPAAALRVLAGEPAPGQARIEAFRAGRTASWSGVATAADRATLAELLAPFAERDRVDVASSRPR